MFRFIVLSVFVVLLSLQLGWVVITPKTYQDFRQIKSFFSELMSSGELDKLKSLGKNQDIIDLDKEESLELYRKLDEKLSEKVAKTAETGSKIRHQMQDTVFWTDIKSIYQDFFSNQ